MTDPNWQRGFYYTGIPPHAGMKLARELATITYRSGPEWEQRFGRRRADPALPPALCPDFLVETYLDHAGEKWCLEYDANSLLYISKAMDLFDLGRAQRMRVEEVRKANRWKVDALLSNGVEGKGGGKEEEMGYDDGGSGTGTSSSSNSDSISVSGNDTNIANTTIKSPEHSTQDPTKDLTAGLAPLANTPTLVLGVASDILFPAWQQREIADTLRRTGNADVTHVELGQDKSVYGHDTFLLDLDGVGGSVGEFLG